MKTTFWKTLVAIAALMPFFALADAAPEKVRPAPTRPIDLVIALDCSNSMDGLISAAKLKLWDIVNELGRAKPRPALRVGLYSYGNDTYNAENGWVRKELDLTDDLDAVYAKLSALTTQGGTEYVARVTRAAVSELKWSTDKDALKLIVVAGNEPATQDPKFSTTEICKMTISKGILINTIYCGSPTNPEAEGWREVARLTDGQFACIDQDKGTVVVSTPFDSKLAELSGEINKTYVGYGRRAAEKAANQSAQDSNALASAPAASAARAVAKSGGLYRNADWDLVDARKEKDFDLAKVKRDELPAEMQKMTREEQVKYLDQKAAERETVQKEIGALNVKRQHYIEAELKKDNKSTDKAFDAAMLRALRKQAEKKNFQFE